MDHSDMFAQKHQIMELLFRTTGSAVFHTTYGNGIVKEASEQIVTICFEDGTTKHFSILTCLQNGYLLPFIPSEKQSKKWFSSIKWTEVCRECQRKSNGYCCDRECAQFNYDEWGDPIPLKLYYADGNNVEAYLEKKRKQKEAECQVK